MAELVRWLGEQLNEDERIARTATQGPWWADSSIHTEAIYGSGNTSVIAGGRWGGEASVFESDADAAHIVAHDPARVLREVDSKRRTLIRCQEALLSASPMLVHFAKQTIWEMARSYSDRSGFKAEEWAP